MAQITRKRGATAPVLVVNLKQTISGAVTAVDLTNATSVTFWMRTVTGGGTVVTGNCTITNAAQGTVQYAWATNDVSATGVYIAEFVITWNDGRIEKVPSGDPIEGSQRADFLTIEIVEDVEGVAPVITGGVGG